MRLKGTITALITPFVGFELDEEGLISNIREQIAEQINGLLILGTTGEVSTLTEVEQAKIISIAVKEGKNKVPIWVGCGSSSTLQTIERTQRAKDLGADVALIATPYFNKPSQEGIYQHFKAIASETEIPIIIYNCPGRAGTNIELSTLIRLAQIPNIVGIKETSGNINFSGDIVHSIVSKNPNFMLFSGDDVAALPMIALGASGLISVVSNLLPSLVMDLVNAAIQGDFERAHLIHYQLLSLFKAVFIETNPVPIKTAMNFCGKPAGECRLPLCPMSSENQAFLHAALRKMDLPIAQEVLS